MTTPSKRIKEILVAFAEYLAGLIAPEPGAQSQPLPEILAAHGLLGDESADEQVAVTVQQLQPVTQTGSQAPVWKKVVLANRSNAPSVSVEVVATGGPPGNPNQPVPPVTISNVGAKDTQEANAPAGAPYASDVTEVHVKLTVDGQVIDVDAQTDPAFPSDRVASVWVFVRLANPVVGTVRLVHSDHDTGPWRTTPTPIP